MPFLLRLNRETNLGSIKGMELESEGVGEGTNKYYSRSHTTWTHVDRWYIERREYSSGKAQTVGGGKILKWGGREDSFGKRVAEERRPSEGLQCVCLSQDTSFPFLVPDNPSRSLQTRELFVEGISHKTNINITIHFLFTFLSCTCFQAFFVLLLLEPFSSTYLLPFFQERLISHSREKSFTYVWGFVID